jgi:hypothetical protein
VNSVYSTNWKDGAKKSRFIPQIQKIKAKRSLFIPQIQKIEAERTQLIPEIGKIKAKKTNWIKVCLRSSCYGNKESIPSNQFR